MFLHMRSYHYQATSNSKQHQPSMQRVPENMLRSQSVTLTPIGRSCMHVQALAKPLLVLLAMRASIWRLLPAACMVTRAQCFCLCTTKVYIPSKSKSASKLKTGQSLGEQSSTDQKTQSESPSTLRTEPRLRGSTGRSVVIDGGAMQPARLSLAI